MRDISEIIINAYLKEIIYFVQTNVRKRAPWNEAKNQN